MCRQITYLQAILTIYYFFCVSVLAQGDPIVYLSEGNKWYYNYHSHYSSPYSSNSEDRIEIKEAIGDTILWDSKVYKKINVTSIGDTNITTRLEYWGIDSSQFFHQYVQNLNLTDLHTFYDKEILDDTSSGCFQVHVYQQEYWGLIRNHQNWSDCIQSGGASINEESTTAFGIGPITILESGYVETGGVGWSSNSNLFGAVIDGIVYGDTITVSVNRNLDKPTRLSLNQNYPNPFNPSTTIEYKVPELSFVTLKVYDVLGKEVATLISEEKQAGEYEVEFNMGLINQTLTSGVYFYQLRAGDPSAGSHRGQAGQVYIETKKMVLLK